MTSESEQSLHNQESRGLGEKRYVECLVRHGVDFATGVPCGVQKYVIKSLSSRPEITHVPATRESEAIGLAAGAFLAGKRPLVYMQNSGLFECLNDISSLLLTYKIPALLSVSWRGAPGEDAPQHFINGQATPSILSTLNIPYFFIEKNNAQMIVPKAMRTMDELRKPVCILIKRGSF